MNFFAKFRLHRNKILAIGFAALALALFVAYYGLQVGLSGFSYFTSNPIEIWNFIIVFIAYFIIFYCNINNDSGAYRGIMMFVFMIVAGQIINFVSGLISNFRSLTSGNALTIILSILRIAFLAGQIVIGVMLYIQSRAYMMMRTSDFKKIRILAILFAVALFLSLTTSVISILRMGYTGSAATLAAFYCLLFLLPTSEVLMAVSTIFTFERLRRF